MTEAYHVSIEAVGDLDGLERVIGVLSRLDLSIVSMSGAWHSGETKIDLCVEGKAHTCELFIRRLAVQVATTSVRCSPCSRQVGKDPDGQN